MKVLHRFSQFCRKAAPTIALLAVPIASALSLCLTSQPGPEQTYHTPPGKKLELKRFHSLKPIQSLHTADKETARQLPGRSSLPNITHGKEKPGSGFALDDFSHMKHFPGRREGFPQPVTSYSRLITKYSPSTGNTMRGSITETALRDMAAPFSGTRTMQGTLNHPSFYILASGWKNIRSFGTNFAQAYAACGWDTLMINQISHAKAAQLRAVNTESNAAMNIKSRIIIKNKPGVSCQIEALGLDANGIFTFRISDGAEKFIDGLTVCIDAAGGATLAPSGSQREFYISHGGGYVRVPVTRGTLTGSATLTAEAGAFILKVRANATMNDLTQTLAPPMLTKNLHSAPNNGVIVATSQTDSFFRANPIPEE